MTEILVIGDATIVHGDSRELLASGEFRPADLLVSDPPYRLTSGGTSGRDWGGMFGSDKYDNGGEIVTMVEFSEWLAKAYLALKLNADAYFFLNDKNVVPFWNEAAAVGFKWHNLLAWKKPNAIPNRWYMKNAEFVIYAYKGRAQKINDCSAAQIIGAPNPNTTGHPNEKPVGLLQVYIENSSKPGDVVLDPFLGSGSTAIAAVRSGRKFLGFEVEREWFDIAAARLRAEYLQPALSL